MGIFNWQTAPNSTGSGFMNKLNRKPQAMMPEKTYTSRPTPEIGKDPALNGMASAGQSVPNPAPADRSIFGMNTDKFVQLAGAMGSAIAPDTPMGRAGAAISNIAGQNIKDTTRAQEIRAQREFLTSGREDEQAHALELETGKQDRLDTRTDKVQGRSDTRLDKEITARKDAATTLATLQNERLKTKNALDKSSTEEERAYNEKQLATQNARIDQLNKENRDYTEKTLKTKDEKDYFRKLITASYNKETGETTPGMAPDSAIKWMAMETRALKEGAKPAPGHLVNTNVSKDGMNKGRTGASSRTVKAPTTITEKKTSIDWGKRLKPMRSLTDEIRNSLKPFGDSLTRNVRNRQGL